LLARLSLTAAASFAESIGALAATIEGSVTFPSGFVPPLTAYASDLESSRVHTVQLARGQAKFTLEVPPGRYAVFLAPNEPGAPLIYGAHTRYSLCSPHIDGKCEDHSLVPVEVSGKSARALVLIDDWYLSDDIARQIDGMRGAAPSGARLDSQPLSAPRFSEYPSATFESSAAPKIDFGGSELSEEDRESVRQALAAGPNFAGHVTAALTHCGPECGRLVLVDWRSGRVQDPTQVAEIQGTLPCRSDEAVLFRRDSRLLSVTRERGDAVVTQYYVWNQKSAALVESGEYQRTPRTFCASGSLSPIMR
jgi:hypothetical protein